jgi:hypothetical protein
MGVNPNGSQTTDDSDTSDSVPDIGAESQQVVPPANNGYGLSFGHNQSFGHGDETQESLVSTVTLMQQRLCDVEKDIRGMKEMLQSVLAGVQGIKEAPSENMETGETNGPGSF